MFVVLIVSECPWSQVNLNRRREFAYIEGTLSPFCQGLIGFLLMTTRARKVEVSIDKTLELGPLNPQL